VHVTKRKSIWLWGVVAFIATLEIAIPLAMRLSRGPLIGDIIGEAVTATPTSSLRVHAGPDSDSAVIGEMPGGASLPVVGRSRDSAWLLVEIGPGQHGWIITWLCEIIGDLESVPVVESEPTPPPTATAELSESATPTDLTGPTPSTVPMSTDTPIIATTSAPLTDTIVVASTPTSTPGSAIDVPTNPTQLAVETPPAETSSQPTMPAASPLNPSSLPYHVTLTGMGYNTRTIFLRGQQLGNNPHAFSKVGDSETADGHFMEPYDLGTYNLAGYAYLEEVVQYFQGSFARQSMAAYPAFSIHQVLDPEWADAEFCEPGETPLACEYRIHRPSFALILVRTWNVDLYYSDLERIIQYSIDQGVVPILSTCPHQTPPPWASEDILNPIIRDLAARYQIPLWDIWATSETLPDRGVCDVCGDHLTMPPPGEPYTMSDFVEPSLQYGATRRNLEGLQVLYIMLHAVIQ
jgi:hypothetical protein